MIPGGWSPISPCGRDLVRFFKSTGWALRPDERESFVLARAYGFDSWPKLKARVDGVTIGRLHDAVERGDADAVRNLLHRRPELVNRDRASYPERLPLHIAVQRRDAAMVRLLMKRGADARSGIWPYRKDTQAVVMAAERGYDEIADIIREQELKHEKPEPEGWTPYTASRVVTVTSSKSSAARASPFTFWTSSLRGGFSVRLFTICRRFSRREKR